MKVIIFLLFVIFCAITYFMYTYIYKGNKSKFIENNEYRESNNNKEAGLILFYTTWCPHCKSTSDIWNTLKTNKKYNNNKYKITFVEIDCDKNPSDATTYNITEYPTIILVKNNKNYVYDANLSEETLDLFINTIMNE